ncbi:hypothetical protein HaLaN_19126 [Haematococcus lacustris]|uniref:Uncharacterized protein n=1 Tax=Haematococcus lacustris TaxID=44745 RepID=A0A699ZZS7_HAELA|nr:hypothetical protein HaLaN_19126 [Haematococcus lacustris]
MGMGLDPDAIKAVNAALGVWDEEGCLESFFTSKLTRRQGEYLHPKWAQQKMRLYGAQEKVLERYFKKLKEVAAMVSQQRWGTRKQLVVFFGNAGIGT